MNTFFPILLLTNSFFEVMWKLFGIYADYVLIVGLSLLSAIAILYLFKWFSNQEKIKYHKRCMLGYILQLRLYQDRLSVITASVMQILKHNLLYIRYTLPSLAIIVVPVFLVCATISARCGYEPFKEGERLIVEAGLNELRQDTLLYDDVDCKTSGGILLETPPLRIPSQKMVFWRARIQNAESGKEEFITVVLGDNEVRKKVLTESNGGLFSPVFASFSTKAALLYSGEGFIDPNSLIAYVAVEAKRKSLPFLFWKLDPLLLYFIFTMAFAFSMKKCDESFHLVSEHNLELHRIARNANCPRGCCPKPSGI